MRNERTLVSVVKASTCSLLDATVSLKCGPRSSASSFKLYQLLIDFCIVTDKACSGLRAELGDNQPGHPIAKLQQLRPSNARLRDFTGANSLLERIAINRALRDPGLRGLPDPGSYSFGCGQSFHPHAK
jgi:hypothetical protein